MSIQCGICKNVMPSASFMHHKERKHSLLDHVPYVKVTDDQVDSNDRTTSAASVAAAIIAAGPLVKCRFCPNRLPKGAMERHLQRCHIDCHLCGKTLLKSNRANHMKQKHGQDARTIAPAAVTVIANSDTMSSSSSSNGDLREMATLSQSKSSVQSDSDGSSTAASTVNLSPAFNTPPVRMPFKSYASSLTSSVSSLLSSTPTPPPSSPVPAKPAAPVPAIKPSNQLHHKTTPSSPALPSAQEPNVIHVDIWQLSRYMRQGRVYKSNGWLYLRNSAINPM